MIFVLVLGVICALESAVDNKLLRGRQSTGTSLINGFCDTPFYVLLEGRSLCHLMATYQTAKASFMTGP